MDGVELFFVLSGFLIGGILIKIIESNAYRLSLKDLLTFWKRRWYRTLPLYYVILLANIVFVYLGWSGGDLSQVTYKFLFFLHNFHSPFHSFFWESWSLSVEEWFYIILPVLLAILLRLLPSKKGILLAIALLIVLPLCYRFTQIDHNLSGDYWDKSVRKVVIMRLDSIIYGVLAAYVKYYYPRIWNRHTALYLIIGVLLMLVIAYIPRHPGDVWTQTFYLNTTSLAAMLMLPFADGIKRYSTFVGKTITHISKISYSMYLVNLALVSSVISLHVPLDSPMEGGLWYLGYWIIVVLVSTILYQVIELPFITMRK